MAKRSGAVHVATTRREYKGKVYETHLLRRTFRDGKKVRNETVGNISHLPPHVIELIRGALKGEEFVAGEANLKDSFDILSTKAHGHVAAVLGAMRQFGLDRAISPRPSADRDRVVAMIIARLLNAGSKLKTTRWWRTTTLPEELGLENTDEDDLYESMDWLLERQDSIEEALAKRHLSHGRLVLYDITSTYLEGHSCELAKFGYSRDGKRDKLQIVFGLLTNEEGCPVAVEVFSGDTGDSSTLRCQISKLRERFGIERIVMVGDRGMITSARIERDLAGEGVDWITALRAPAIRKLRRAGTIQLSFFDERDLAVVEDPDYPGEQLVVCRNPLLLEDRRRTRKELLEATEKQLERIASTVRSGRLKNKAAIGVRVGKVIDRYKVGKHFLLEIDDGKFSFCRNERSIREEEALDGIYVLRTSLPPAEMSGAEVVVAYKRLCEVERAFRSLKTVSLKVRPIYHWREKRVRAHVFLCMLAYCVQWHLERALAPLLFYDEVRGLGPPKSPVARAVRSESAKAKDHTKRRPDGEPVHSLDTLFAELSTLARHRVCSKSAPASEFQMITRPSALHRDVFALLGIKSPA